MNKQKVAKELLKLAKQIVSNKDNEFIADQLLNAWDSMNEKEMINHLAKNTDYSKSKLKKIVDDWYDDVSLRMKMDLARASDWDKWIKKELR